MDYILPIFTGISLSALLGFRAFLPPLILGLAYRLFPSAININEGFAFLAQDPVLIALGVASILELLCDKVPWIDHFVDQAALPAKIALSIVLSLALIPGSNHWFYMLIAIVFSTGTTLTVHAGKTTLRGSATAMTGGVSTPFIGVVEDTVTITGSIIAILTPIVAVVLVLFLTYKCLKFIFGRKGGNDGKLKKSKPSILFHNITRLFFQIVLKLYNRMDIYGQELIPTSGPYMVVSNHGSILDGFIIITGLKEPLYIMAKKEAFERPILGWYLRKVLAFPVDRSKPDTNAVKNVLRILSRGDCIGMFPEGTRNLEGKVSKFKQGAIKFALKKQIPIVPVYILNSHRLLPNGTNFPHPVKMSLTFMPPIDTKAELLAGKTDKDILEKLYNTICDKGSEVAGYDVREKPKVEADINIEPKLDNIE